MMFTRRGIFQAITAAVAAIKGECNLGVPPKKQLEIGMPTAEKTAKASKWFVPKIHPSDCPVYQDTNLGKAVIRELLADQRRPFELLIFDGSSKEFSAAYPANREGWIRLNNIESLANPRIQIKPSTVRVEARYALLPIERQPKISGVFGAAKLGDGDIAQLGVLDLHGLKLPDGTVLDQRRWMAKTVMGEGPEFSLEGAPSDSIESWEGLPERT